MKARSRRAPAVEKGPSWRARPLRKPHWTRSGRRRPTRSFSSARRHQFANCHRAHRAAAVWYRYMGNL